jgi:hypothetical protein
VERRLRTIYAGAMANYSYIISYNILQTHSEGHAFSNEEVKVKVLVGHNEESSMMKKRVT